MTKGPENIPKIEHGDAWSQEITRGKPVESENDAMVGAGEVSDGVPEVDSGSDLGALVSFDEFMAGKANTPFADEEGNFHIGVALSSADKNHPEYEPLLESASRYIGQKQVTVEDLVSLCKGDKPQIHPTVLERILEKYTEEKRFNKVFMKVVEVLVQLHHLDYSLSQEMPINQDSARFNFFLEKTESIFLQKKAIEIIELVKQGRLHPSIIKELSKSYLNNQTEGIVAKRSVSELGDKMKEVMIGVSLYEAYFVLEDDIKNLQAGEVKLLIDGYNFDRETLISLLELYKNKHRIDPGGCKEKIEAALKM